LPRLLTLMTGSDSGVKGKLCQCEKMMMKVKTKKKI